MFHEHHAISLTESIDHYYCTAASIIYELHRIKSIISKYCVTYNSLKVVNPSAPIEGEAKQQHVSIVLQ